MERIVEIVSEGIIHISYISTDSRKQEYCDCLRYEYGKNRNEEGNEPLFAQTEIKFIPKTVYRYEVDGEPILKKKMTANGEVSYIENEKQIEDKTAYLAQLSFEIGEEELLLGMGQYEDGIMDYRNHTEYLYESNMRIAIPFLVTTGHYAILIDSESNMIFQSQGRKVTFEIDTLNELSYYVFLADDTADLIKLYHKLTGAPSMLPRWAFGYIQSKERYNSSDELEDVAKKFREKNIPIDCLVQDWYSWEEGLWGEKIFDKKRYPNMSETNRCLMDENVHLMVSIWPNMSQESSNYKEFKDAGKLMRGSNLYDAFDEEARSLYWEQCRREIMESGTDALWCDNAEPFSDADWSGQYKKPEDMRYKVVTETSKRSMDWERLNAYGLYHAKGIYENWRKSYPNKRVLNLTRSGYTGCQKYGTILWSGDITAKWETMRHQIAEGIKMGLSGMPYWTLDIGGFFVVKDKYENRGCNDTAHLPLWFWAGDYNDGVKDMGYRELYVRWLQMGAFLPIFRSHGTDTPREPWQFGDKGDIFYDTIVKYIKLRYRWMPYIYSLGAAAHFNSEIIMRSLLLDFGYDEKVRDIADEYMLGPSLLVAPVCEAMYYGPDSVPINPSFSHGDITTEDNKEVVDADINRTRKVYLPKGCGWYDYHTDKYYEGGQEVIADAPIDKIPLFVRAGAIIPVSEGLKYADEKRGLPDEIIVYKGADGEFLLYNDSGNGYDYEKGQYSLQKLCYCDNTGELRIEKVGGDYPVPKEYSVKYVGGSN